MAHRRGAPNAKRSQPASSATPLGEQRIASSASRDASGIPRGRPVHPSDWTLASETCRRAGRGQPLRQHRGQAGRGYGGASYPAPLSLAAVVVPTAGRAAKPPVPLSAAQYSRSCPRSHRTAGQESGGKRVGPARRGRRGKGGGEWTRMRSRAETAPCPPGRPRASRNEG